MTQQELLDHLKASAGLKTQNLLQAFTQIDRADFVPSDLQDLAYEDYPLPIGFGQTISQPMTVVFMLELLQPQIGEYILDVGSGSGWTTALLAEAVGKPGKVYGVELIPELVKLGQINIKKYELSQASIEAANPGVIGLPNKAPFDKILVSAAGHTLPPQLVEQCKVGGRIVMPIKDAVCKIDKVEHTKIVQTKYPGFAFVPLK
jgi:protein-L-isoaspartate(D-aspartate) O-methyltransferase